MRKNIPEWAQVGRLVFFLKDELCEIVYIHSSKRVEVRELSDGEVMVVAIKDLHPKLLVVTDPIEYSLACYKCDTFDKDKCAVLLDENGEVLTTICKHEFVLVKVSGDEYPHVFQVGAVVGTKLYGRWLYSARTICSLSVKETLPADHDRQLFISNHTDVIDVSCVLDTTDVVCFPLFKEGTDDFYVKYMFIPEQHTVQALSFSAVSELQQLQRLYLRGGGAGLAIQIHYDILTAFKKDMVELLTNRLARLKSLPVGVEKKFRFNWVALVLLEKSILAKAKFSSYTKRGKLNGQHMVVLEVVASDLVEDM